MEKINQSQIPLPFNSSIVPIVRPTHVPAPLKSYKSNPESVSFEDSLLKEFDAPNMAHVDTLYRVFYVLKSLCSSFSSSLSAQGNFVESLDSFLDYVNSSIGDFFTNAILGSVTRLFKSTTTTLLGEKLRNSAADVSKTFLVWCVSLYTNSLSALETSFNFVTSIFQFAGIVGHELFALVSKNIIAFLHCVWAIFSVKDESGPDIVDVNKAFQANAKVEIDVPTHEREFVDSSVDLFAEGVEDDHIRPFKGFAKGLLSQSSFDLFSKKCANINTLFITSEKMLRLGSYILNYILNTYVAYTTGVDPNTIPVLNFIPKGQEFVERFEAAMSDKNLRDCKFDRASRDRVTSLRTFADTLLVKMPRNIETSARASFDKLVARVVQQDNVNRTYCSGDVKNRIEPVGVALMGPPGICKDTVLRFLTSALARAWHVPDALLTKNAASQYYSNFLDQPFLLLSEFQAEGVANKKDGPPEAREVLDLINNSPHLLVVENEQLKSISYANFWTVFLSTNRKTFDLTNLFDQGAFNRRIPIRAIPIPLHGTLIDTSQAKFSQWSDFKNLRSMVGVAPVSMSPADFMFNLIDSVGKSMGIVTFDSLVQLILNARQRNTEIFTHNNSLASSPEVPPFDLSTVLVAQMVTDAPQKEEDSLDDCSFVITPKEAESLVRPINLADLRKRYVVTTLLVGLLPSFRSYTRICDDQEDATCLEFLHNKLNLRLMTYTGLIHTRLGIDAPFDNHKFFEFLAYYSTVQEIRYEFFINALMRDSYNVGVLFDFFVELADTIPHLHGVRLPDLEVTYDDCFAEFATVFAPTSNLYTAKGESEAKALVADYLGRNQSLAKRFSLFMQKHPIFCILSSLSVVGVIGYGIVKMFQLKNTSGYPPKPNFPEHGTGGSSDSGYDKSSHNIGRANAASKILHRHQIHQKNYNRTQRPTVELKGESATDERSFNLANSIVQKNCVFVTFQSPECDETSRIYGIFVHSKFLLLPRHALPQFKKYKQISLSNTLNSHFAVFPTANIPVRSAGGSYDFMIAYVSQALRHSDITKHLVTFEDCDTLHTPHIALYKPGVAGTPRTTQAFFGDAHYSDNNAGEYTVSGQVFCTTGYLRYDVPTAAGDCGSPIFLVNNTLQRKLIAFHTAGDANSKKNFGQVLYQSVILSVLDTFPEFRENCALVGQCFADPVPHLAPAAADFSISIPNHAYQWSVPQKYATTTGIGKTKLRASIFEPTFLDGEFLPAVRATDYVDGDLIMHNLARKARFHNPGIATEFADAWNALQEEIVHTSRKRSLDQTVLSFDQAINGIDGQPYVDAMPKDTSSGWPDSVHYKAATKTFLKVPAKVETLEKDVSDFLVSLTEGVPEVTFTLFGKDELRAKNKIEDGSIRLVYGCPTHVTVAFRMLFGPFIAWIMENHVENHIAVGINVHGPMWSRLADSLLAKGDSMIDFDIKDFDYNQCPNVLTPFVSFVNDWAADGEDTARMRRNLWDSMINAHMIYGTSVFQRIGNICSGCPVTAVVNSMITLVYMLVAWNRVMTEMGVPHLKDYRNFFIHCAAIAFGDDNVLSIHEFIRKYFNPTTIARALLSIGVTVTDATTKVAATGDVPFKTLSMCWFLQRAFEYHEGFNRFVAPLRLQSIKKMMSWYRKCPDPTTAITDNLDTAFSELSIHPVSTYEEVRKQVKDVCSNHSFAYVPPTQNRALQMQHAKEMSQNAMLEAQGLEPCVHDPHHKCKSKTLCYRCGSVHCDFYIWYYGIDPATRADYPSLRSYNISCDFYEYVDFWAGGSILQHWYGVYNIIKWQREFRCDKFRPELCVAPDVEIEYDDQKWLKIFNTKINYLPVLTAQSETGSSKKQQLTRFQDDATSLTYTRPGMTNCQFQTVSLKESEDHSLQSFLGRVVEIANVSLVNGGTQADIVNTTSFPGSILNNAMWLDKIKNFRCLRATVNLRFQINSAPTDTGLYYVFFSPYQSLAGVRTYSDQLPNITGYPGAYIDVGTKNVMQVTIPYVSPLSAYDLVGGEGTLGEFAVATVAPFQSFAATSGTLQIKCWLTDVVLSIPTPYDPPALGLRAQSETHTRRKNATGTISDITGKFGSAFSSLGNVPVIGETSSAIGTGLNVISRISKEFGHCKETNLKSITPTNFVPMRDYTAATGLDDSVFLGAHPDNMLLDVPGLSGTTLNEMNIRTFASREAICHTFTMDTSMAVGTILAKIPICPGYCIGGTATTVNTTPLSYVGGPFEKWRGSLVYRFQVAKNAFYNFRLKIVVVPGYAPAAVDNTFNFAACEHELIDFEGTSQNAFKVDFNTCYPILTNILGNLGSSDPEFGGTQSSLGTLVVITDSVIRTMNNVPPTLYGFITIRGGPDIEFFQPTFTNVQPLSSLALSLHEKEEEDEVLPVRLVAQSETIQGTFTGISSVLAETTGDVAAHPTLTAAHSDGLHAAEACIGERWTDIREIIKRTAWLPPFAITPTNHYVTCDPSWFGDGTAPPDANAQNVPLWYYSWAFRFYRGSTRYKTAWFPPAVPVATESVPSLIYAFTAPVRGAAQGPTAPVPQSTATTHYGSTFSHLTYGHFAVNPTNEIAVPFYRIVPMAVISSTNTSFDNNRTIAYFDYRLLPSTTATVLFGIAAGDDFEFLYQIGTPPVAILP